jgi:exosortase/archaeosortase family protein
MPSQRPTRDASGKVRASSPRFDYGFALRFILIGLVAGAIFFPLSLDIQVRDAAEIARYPLLEAGVKFVRAAQNRVLYPYHEGIAATVGAIVTALGHEAQVTGRELRGAGLAFVVTHGCDGWETSVLWAAAVLAWPAPLGRKLAGLFAGLGILALLNIARIAVLWIVGVRWRAFFDVAHFSVFPVLLIAAAGLLFLCWQHLAGGVTDAPKPWT